MPRGRAATVSALALGALIVAAWLVGWHLLADAAAFFAPATVAVGVGALVAGGCLAGRIGPTAARALPVAGGGAVGLAVVAALSLGAFLPTGLAAWVSPALGRFGGGPALLLLAGALVVAGVLRRPACPDGRALDLAALCAVAAGWVWVQTGRQIAFPPPPTVPTFVPGRITAIALAATLLAGVVVVVRGLRQFRPAWGALAGPYGRWATRWGVVAVALGLPLVVAFAPGRWLAFVPAALLLIDFRRFPAINRAVLPALMRRAAGRVGWLIAALLALVVVYAATSEDLEAVFARNTLERRALLAWEGVLGDQRGVAAAGGALAGTVRDDAGRPVAGAAVVVADIAGRTYAATSGADGRYAIAAVPAGNYLPLATAPAYRQGGRAGLAGRVATVRAGATAGGVDFRLAPRPAYDPAANDSLRLGEPSPITIEGLQTDTVLRRTFTFENRGKLLDGGLVHEPLPEAGPGPFPILLIVYPGEAASWEGVSVPLAAKGYVVVSYFPRRLIDHDGDLDDLRVLLNLAAAGRLSARGDGGRIVLVGGSVSTIYIYQLARSFAGDPFAAKVPALVQYGGLFDFFAFRERYEAGVVVIDFGISELEYLIVALGRPDTRPEIYLRLSPRFGLAPDPLSRVPRLPPTLLVHAERDIIVPAEQSRLAAAGFAQVGIPHELLLYPDLEHYLDLSKRDPAQLDMLERTVAFLRTWTGPGRR